MFSYHPLIDDRAIDKSLIADLLPLIFEYYGSPIDQDCGLLFVANEMPCFEKQAKQVTQSAAYIFYSLQNVENASFYTLFYLNKYTKELTQLKLNAMLVNQLFHQLKPTQKVSLLSMQQVALIEQSTSHQHLKRTHYNHKLSFINNLKQQRLQLIAEDIVNGSVDDNPLCLSLLENDPHLINETVEIKDPIDRPIVGKPLEMIAILGDFNLYKEINEEKKQGLFERAVTRLQLSKQDIEKTLSIITSKKAKQANNKRKEDILHLFKKLTEIVIETCNQELGTEQKTTYDCDTLTQKLQINVFKTKRDITQDDFDKTDIATKPCITQFKNDLAKQNQKIIQSGYIFDLTLLDEITQWLETRLGKSDVYHADICQNIIEYFTTHLLQNLLSCRDLQIMSHGLNDLFEKKIIAARNPTKTMKNGVIRKQLENGYTFGYTRTPPDWYAPSNYFSLFQKRKEESIAKLLTCSNNSNKIKS